MRTLDAELAKYLDSVSVSYFKHHPNLPPSINFALSNFSNRQCFHHVSQFCIENEIALQALFDSVGYPVIYGVISNLDKIKNALMLRGTILNIDDAEVHESFSHVITHLSIVVTPSSSPTNCFISDIDTIDAIEYLSLMDGNPINRIDSLSITKDIGFMTALTLRRYIESGDGYYLVPAIPNLIEREHVKLSAVLRHIEDESYDKLPMHLSSLILSVQLEQDICIETILSNLVFRTWPVTQNRIKLLLDKHPSIPQIKSNQSLACNLFCNPSSKVYQRNFSNREVQNGN